MSHLCDQLSSSLSARSHHLYDLVLEVALKSIMCTVVHRNKADLFQHTALRVSIVGKSLDKCVGYQLGNMSEQQKARRRDRQEDG